MLSAKIDPSRNRVILFVAIISSSPEASTPDNVVALDREGPVAVAEAFPVLDAKLVKQ